MIVAQPILRYFHRSKLLRLFRAAAQEVAAELRVKTAPWGRFGVTKSVAA